MSDWSWVMQTEMADGYVPPSASMNPEPELTVHKYGGFVPVSLELAMDCGLISEEEARARGWTPTVYPPVPRWTRLRWRWSAMRERLGRKLGGWIAGVDLSERDDDY